MRALAAVQRYEEAGATRDRAASLARAIEQQRRLEALRRAGRLVVDVPEQGEVVLERGRLTDGTLLAPLDDGWVPRDLVDELRCVASWLDAEAARIRLVECGGELASPLPALPSFEPAKAPR